MFKIKVFQVDGPNLLNILNKINLIANLHNFIESLERTVIRLWPR